MPQSPLAQTVGPRHAGRTRETGVHRHIQHEGKTHEAEEGGEGAAGWGLRVRAHEGEAHSERKQPHYEIGRVNHFWPTDIPELAEAGTFITMRIRGTVDGEIGFGDRVVMPLVNGSPACPFRTYALRSAAPTRPSMRAPC